MNTAESTDWPAWLEPIVQRYGADPTQVLRMLVDIQDAQSWVPPEALTYLAGRLDLPRARIEGVAGFYTFLHTDQPCRYNHPLFGQHH